MRNNSALMKKYEGMPPVGVLPLSNFGGLEVLDVEGGDHVIACFEYGSGRKNIGRHKVEYTMAGRPYFRKYGARYYIDQILACGR